MCNTCSIFCCHLFWHCIVWFDLSNSFDIILALSFYWLNYIFTSLLSYWTSIFLIDQAIQFSWMLFWHWQSNLHNTLSLDMRHVQTLCQAQNNGTELGVKCVAGKTHTENIRAMTTFEGVEKVRRSRHLLDHTDVCLHVHHVSVPPVILEAQHQRVWLQPAQSCSLREESTNRTQTKLNWGRRFFYNFDKRKEEQQKKPLSSLPTWSRYCAPCLMSSANTGV